MFIKMIYPFGKNRNRCKRNIRCRRCGLCTCSFEGFKQAGVLGLGSLPVVWQRPSTPCPTTQKLGAPTGFHYCAKHQGFCRSRFCCSSYRRHHDHARLPKVPAAEKIDIDSAGVISGLFKIIFSVSFSYSIVGFSTARLHHCGYSRYKFSHGVGV